MERVPGLKILCTSGFTEAAKTSRYDNKFPLLSKPYRMGDLSIRLREILERS